jgi:hypothetical protein
MTHSFQFDPNAILGISQGATLREIRDAYHQKSLKHHPDKGGDDWAFRMITRAYEILSTARVVDRADADWMRHGSPRSHSTPEQEPRPRSSWPHGFGPESASSRVDVDTDSTIDLKNWGGAFRSHEADPPEQTARIVTVELLILRFELESSLDLFARNPEDRNLSCSLHISWPVLELAEQASTIADAARTLKKLGEAFKVRGVRKHAVNKQMNVDHSRFEGWLTYPTAVMASEALDALLEALKSSGLEVEKQTREMSIPRPRG